MEEPTHTSGNILDLVLTDKEGLVSDVKLMGRIGMSDHELILPCKCREQKQFRQADKPKIPTRKLRQNADRIEDRQMGRNIEGAKRQ